MSGYIDTSGHSIDDAVLDHLIDLRADALRGWIDDLDDAPIGIRTASPDWLATLRSFVDAPRPPPWRAALPPQCEAGPAQGPGK